MKVDGIPVSVRRYYWDQLPDDQATVSYIAPEIDSVVQFPIGSVNRVGALLYDIAKPRVIRDDRPVIGKGNGERHIIGGANGRVYLNQDPIIAEEADGRL